MKIALHGTTIHLMPYTGGVYVQVKNNSKLSGYYNGMTTETVIAYLDAKLAWNI